MSHTPEKWKADTYAYSFIWGSNMEMIADLDEEQDYVVRMRGAGENLSQKENALRIVSCVNACAGMADPAEEIQAMRKKINSLTQSIRDMSDFYVEEKREVEKLRADKARLVDFVIEVSKMLDTEGDNISAIDTVETAKQLLAEMEGKK